MGAGQKGPCSSRATCCHREGHKSHPSHCRHKSSTIPPDPPVPAHPLSSGQLPTPQAPLTFLGRIRARLACGTPARARAPTLGEAPRQRVRRGPLALPRSPAATRPRSAPRAPHPGASKYLPAATRLQTARSPDPRPRRAGAPRHRGPARTGCRRAPAVPASRSPSPQNWAGRAAACPHRGGRLRAGGRGGKNGHQKPPPPHPGAWAGGFLPASADPSSRSRRWKHCGNSPTRVASSAGGPAPSKGKHARAGARTRVGSGVAVPTRWQRAPAALRTTAARGGGKGREPPPSPGVADPPWPAGRASHAVPADLGRSRSPGAPLLLSGARHSG